MVYHGLPKKNGWIFHGKLLVITRGYFRDISEIPVVGWLFDIICPSVAVLSQKKTNDWGVGRGPCGMVLNPWHGFLAVPCSLSPWCLDFHFHDVWPLLFYPLLNIIFHFLCFFPNDSTQAVQAQRIMSTLEDGQGAPPSCPDFFFRKFPWFI